MNYVTALADDGIMRNKGHNHLTSNYQIDPELLFTFDWRKPYAKHIVTVFLLTRKILKPVFTNQNDRFGYVDTVLKSHNRTFASYNQQYSSSFTSQRNLEMISVNFEQIKRIIYKWKRNLHFYQKLITSFCNAG